MSTLAQQAAKIARKGTKSAKPDMRYAYRAAMVKYMIVAKALEQVEPGARYYVVLLMGARSTAELRGTIHLMSNDDKQLAYKFFEKIVDELEGQDLYDAVYIAAELTHKGIDLTPVQGDEPEQDKPTA